MNFDTKTGVVDFGAGEEEPCARSLISDAATNSANSPVGIGAADGEEDGAEDGVETGVEAEVSIGAADVTLGALTGADDGDVTSMTGGGRGRAKVRVAETPL